MRGRNRIAAVLTAVLLAVGMAACVKDIAPKPKLNPAEQLSRPFESTVSVKYKELEATARVARQAPGYCRISFTSPEELTDMSVEFTTDKVNINYKKLHASFLPDSIPGSAISSLLVDAINAAAKESGVVVDYKDGVFTLSGQMESGTFTMTLDEKSGNLMHLSVPADGFEATFRDFSFLAET